MTIYSLDVLLSQFWSTPFPILKQSMHGTEAASGQEIPHVQGKEQELCFTGAAMKRYPTSKVREIPVRP